MGIKVDAGLLPPPPEYSIAAYLLMVSKSKGVEFKQDELDKNHSVWRSHGQIETPVCTGDGAG